MLENVFCIFKGFLSLPEKMNIHLPYLLVTFLIHFLTDTASQKPPWGFIYASYEITIPKSLAFKSGHQKSKTMTYVFQIEGRNFVMHLRQKRGLIPKYLPIFTYSKDGELQLDYPFFMDDCYYNGVLEGEPFSLAIISTCSGGLRGLLQFKNKIYEIEPLPESATFQHIVFRLEEKVGVIPMMCGLTQEEQRHQEAMIQNPDKKPNKIISKRNWWPHERYAEIAIVIDHERFLKFGKNETLTVINILDIFYIANVLYEPLSVRLSIAGLEIWSERNLISIHDDIGETLEDFTNWRRDSLLARLPNDAGHLFIFKNFGREVGLAYLGTICDDNKGSAVESYVTSNLYRISNTFIHELGHNLGMQHDTKYCLCDRAKCIMAHTQVLTDQFSNCSYIEYFSQRNLNCLLIPPDPNKIFKFKFCGNKVVDNGEQCDCGTKGECKLHPCCQYNCTLRLGATCAFGQCCAKCQYQATGTICRNKTNSCDFPEYCNGVSERCPEDFYVQDGAPCGDGAYCYKGNCHTHDRQCKAIFGSKAIVASEVCFREMNTEGDRFGNCGLIHGIYNKCIPNNILCGRIQCENVESLPSLEDHTTIVQTFKGNKQCWGTDYHSGMKIIDIGAVRDGTPCGNDMMCINRECVNVSLLRYDCDVTKCHNRGICNNFKHCHCEQGWAPPDCKEEGNGGSIDSGPPPLYERERFHPKLKIILAIVFPLCALVLFGACLRNQIAHRTGQSSGQSEERSSQQE
ncbi:disintegrin and metalloproteinase domain-containing protein 20-like [Crotalus tigris]|uniref:disintegrin and metalloproteinase domain-containing protein 20-like n=1 Tax=Crotalus tigris TaxID=88082 RepID=UPI00192FB3C1|nr:disintegrin and metalloproteinase domain-containing protein 20-like [Crotalus tigris]